MRETKKLFDSPEFEKRFHCGLPLGTFPSPEGTLFRLWAPTAEKVTLRLCPTRDSSEAKEAHPLLPEGGGTWVWGTGHDLDGTYYDYEVTVDGVCRATADPYARACGLNGARSMVVDLHRTDPPRMGRRRAPSPRTGDNYL